MSIFELNNQLGYSSPIVFEDNTSEEDFYAGVIDFEKLADHIAKYRRFDFDYNNYISDKMRTFSIDSYDVTGPISYSVSNPLRVKNENGVKRELDLRARLNKRGGLIKRSQGKFVFDFKLNLRTKNIRYIKQVKYAFSNDLAIEVIAPNYEDYSDFSKYIGVQENDKVRRKIISVFNDSFRSLNDDIPRLKWLYEEAPQFVLQQRGDALLIEDLKKLLQYDLEATLSWFKDSSGAVMKILTGFQNPKVLYDYFDKHPEVILALYSAINDDSYKMALGTLMTTLSYVFASPEKQKQISFTIGKDYTLDSNLFIDKGQKRINLQQLKYEYKSVSVERPAEDATVTIKSRKTVEIPKSQTQFHPLDLVRLRNDKTGETELVCALQVKVLSDKAEWKTVIEVTNAVITVIGILASVVALLVGATGVAAVIAIAELAVSLGDLTFLLKRANLDGTEEGDWFLEHWEKISLSVGVLSIGSALHQGFIKHGPRVLGRLSKIRNISSINVRKHIEALLTQIQVELYFTFREGLVLVGFEPFSLLAKRFGDSLAQKMRRFGVQLTTQTGDKEKIRALVYQGQNIAEGSDKELKEALKKMFPLRAKDGDIVKYLDDVAEVSRSLIPLKTIDELIVFLGKLNSKYRAIDLEKTGIKVLFRGTTRENGVLFKGNSNSIEFGISTSTDPVRAIIFGLESASVRGREGYLQVFLPKDLKGINLQLPNRRHKIELEVILNENTDRLSRFVHKEIPIEKARNLANKFFSLEESLPTRFVPETGESRRFLNELKVINLENSYKFLNELLKL